MFSILICPVSLTVFQFALQNLCRYTQLRRCLSLSSSASTRAQRASARNLGAGAAPNELPMLQETLASSSHQIPVSDPAMIATDIDEPMLSRSNSVLHMDEPMLLNGSKRSSGSRKDKEKGKEKEGSLRVKDEPLAVNLNHTEAPQASVCNTICYIDETKGYLQSNLQSNEDHCSSCRSLGSLVYCDGCPRAFHLWCLDPPMEASDLPEGDSRWLCPACEIDKVRRMNCTSTSGL